jgi:hypothetical protein
MILENFAEFSLGKVRKKRSELLIQGQKWKIGGGEEVWGGGGGGGKFFFFYVFQYFI